MVTAIVKNHRQSPRKVRLVADFVRGKRIAEAMTTLSFLSKRAASPIMDVIQSAVSNAKHNMKLDPDTLVIKEIRVDEGVVLKRFLPSSRGSAKPIKKRTSHIRVVLGEQATEKAKKAKKTIK